MRIEAPAGTAIPVVLRAGARALTWSSSTNVPIDTASRSPKNAPGGAAAAQGNAVDERDPGWVLPQAPQPQLGADIDPATTILRGPAEQHVEMKPVGGALDPTERGEPNEDIQKDSLVPRVLPDVVELTFSSKSPLLLPEPKANMAQFTPGSWCESRRFSGVGQERMKSTLSRRLLEWIGGQRIQGGPLRRDECVEPSRKNWPHLR